MQLSLLRYLKSNAKPLTLIACTFVLVSVLLLNFEPAIFGFAVAGSRYNQAQVMEYFSGSATFNVSFDSPPSFIRLSGYALGGNDVVVWARIGDSRYLVLNSSDMVEVPPMIDRNISALVDLINSSQGISEEVTTVLDYAPQSVWDVDDDGVEPFYQAIDFTVNNTEFLLDLSDEKLCTLWQVYSVFSGNLTTICHGADGCCLLYGLSPVTGSEWDDIFYLTYGRYSATSKNIVGAKVVYSGIKGDDPDNEYGIYRGGWDFKTAHFYTPLYSFDEVCQKTCELANTSSDVLVEVEVGGHTSVNLTRILYLSTPSQVIDYPPARISNLTINVVEEYGDVVGHYELFKDFDGVDVYVSNQPKDMSLGVHVISEDNVSQKPYVSNAYVESGKGYSRMSTVNLTGLRTQATFKHSGSTP